MRLTRQGDYAVRIMVDLAAHAGEQPVARAAIQRRQDVPGPYLAKIVQTLARAGLVRTRPGTGGGVWLTLPPEAITLRRVIEAVEGPIALNRCLTRPSGCGRETACPVHPVWARIQAMLTGELDRHTIAALAAASPADGQAPRERPCPAEVAP